MPIYKREGSPYWQFSITVRGARLRGSTGETEREAALAAEARERLRLTTARRHAGRLTLSQALGRYWIDHAEGLSSAVDITRGSRLLIARLGAGTWLDQLTDADIALYVSRRRGDTRQGRGQKGRVGPASVNRELALLRAVIRIAADRWKVEVPRLNWRDHALREPAPRSRTLKVDEARRLLEAAAEHLKGPILFSLYTGARWSNTRFLDWTQIDMRAREVLFHQKSKLPGGRPHVVPLAEPVFLVLANLGPKAAGPVWHRRGQPITDWMWAWRDALARAGLPDLRWHDLRRTAGTWMLQNNVPLDMVQRILGHADIRTTQRAYAFRPAGAARAAVAALPVTFEVTTDPQALEKKQA